MHISGYLLFKISRDKVLYDIKNRKFSIEHNLFTNRMKYHFRFAMMNTISPGIYRRSDFSLIYVPYAHDVAKSCINLHGAFNQ
jgi:hypothetical protein